MRLQHLATVIGLCLLPLSPGLGAPEPEELDAVVDRIQRECLKAYPEELLAEMTSGEREIPSYVDRDPKIQMQFLQRVVDGEKGPFYPSLLEDLLPTFRDQLSAETRFLDLGSGDGRVVFLAGALGANATGIEYDEQLVELSHRALEALSDVIDVRRVQIVQGDFFESSWSGYDVVFYFDLSSIDPDRVRDKLRRELDPGAVLVVGHEQAPFPGLQLEDALPHLEAPAPYIKLYRRPSE